MDFLRALRQFYRESGHHLVSHFGRHRALRAWVDAVREQWRQGELPPRLEQSLTALHFPFDDNALAWEQTFAQVATLTRRHKRLPPESVPVGAWIRGQLMLAELGSLDAGRAARVHGLSRWISSGAGKRATSASAAGRGARAESPRTGTSRPTPSDS